MKKTTFCKLPVDSYFRRCATPRTKGAIYKKVKGPYRWKGRRVRGAMVQLKRFGAERRFFPAESCFCVVRLTERYAKTKAAEKYRKERRAARRGQ
jgi:hypothetical protein